MDDIKRVNSAIRDFLRRPVNVNNESFHNLLDYIHYIEDEYPATGFRVDCNPRDRISRLPITKLCRSQGGARNYMDRYTCVHSAIITVIVLTKNTQIFSKAGLQFS